MGRYERSTISGPAAVIRVASFSSASSRATSIGFPPRRCVYATNTQPRFLTFVLSIPTVRALPEEAIR